MASSHNVDDESERTTQVELSVSCRNLADTDFFSKSDPICVLYEWPVGSDSYREIGRTEVIWNNLNPEFVTKFTINYTSQRVQKLKFELYDIDSESRDLSKHDFLGAMQCTLAEIVACDVSFKRPLNGPHSQCGEIIVVCEELSTCKDNVTLQFSALNLDKKKIFGLSDPFLTIRRVNGDKSFTLVYKTETIMNTQDPKWRKLIIAARSLCNMDYDRQLKIECFDWNKNGSHELIGEFSTTLNELLRGPAEFECINPELKEKRGNKYSNSGKVKLLECQLSTSYTFLDYIRSGIEVQCIVAIDFTSLKPGAKHDGKLIHSQNADEQCLYATALKAVVKIIQEYDTDKKIPAIGFGCKVPPDWLPSPVYFLNGIEENVECDGINGVLAAYRNAVKTLRCHSPTSFAPLINYIAGLASKQPGNLGDTYFILLIVTDGKISDMPQTLDAIVQASILPLSIIIVGIGAGPFDDMEILDGDSVRVAYKDREAASDIVQFVPLHDFIGGINGDDLENVKQRLTHEVLAEVPRQFVSYMARNGVKPKPKNV